MLSDNPGCLGFILQAIGLLPKQADENLPYAKRDDFLSPSELSFYKILTQVVSDKAIICPKVTLKEIFFVKTRDRSDFTVYNNKINLKHVDFLLCSNDRLEPICGIELDDITHNRQDRIERDAFVEKVFSTAGLKLLRFQNKKSYSILDLAEKINPIIQQTQEIIDSVEVKKEEPIIEEQLNHEISTNIPICKKCGIPMVLRKAKKGEHVGDDFWGCVNFPKCRETMKAENE